MDGVLIVDKPAGMTSHDVVSRARRLARERSVGHLGTLDPMATGVLPLVLGKMTRLAQFYLGASKSYEGTIRFGWSTDTFDATGELVGEVQPANLSLKGVQAAARSFVGSIEQMPPPFSAKKIAGVPAYRLARKKQPVGLKPVRVEVSEFEILSLEGDLATFRASVSSGTYLRFIAHELGQRLGVGGHLDSLRRTKVGEFSLEEAHTLDSLPSASMPTTSDNGYYVNSDFARYLLHPRAVLPEFPAVTAMEEVLPRLLNGNAVNLPEFSSARLVRVFRGQADLVAIAQRVAGTLFQPKVVLASPKANSIAIAPNSKEA